MTPTSKVKYEKVHGLSSSTVSHNLHYSLPQLVLSRVSNCDPNLQILEIGKGNYLHKWDGNIKKCDLHMNPFTVLMTFFSIFWANFTMENNILKSAFLPKKE